MAFQEDEGEKIMDDLGVCKTVGELKKVLENLDDELAWSGWDDGCIYIHDIEGTVAYIKPEDYC
jgi:hypothetical protein